MEIYGSDNIDLPTMLSVSLKRLLERGDLDSVVDPLVKQVKDQETSIQRDILDLLIDFTRENSGISNALQAKIFNSLTKFQLLQSDDASLDEMKRCLKLLEIEQVFGNEIIGSASISRSMVGSPPEYLELLWSFSKQRSHQWWIINEMRGHSLRESFKGKIMQEWGRYPEGMLYVILCFEWSREDIASSIALRYFEM